LVGPRILRPRHHGVWLIVLDEVCADYGEAYFSTFLRNATVADVFRTRSFIPFLIGIAIFAEYLDGGGVLIALIKLTITHLKNFLYNIIF